MSKVKMVISLVVTLAGIVTQAIDAKDIAKDIKGADEKSDDSK